MISANFYNFDAAGNNLPTEATGKHFSEKDFASFFDQMFVYPTNASVQFQNANQPANAEGKEIVPICIKPNDLNFTAKDNVNQRVLPNPMETAGESPIETPPILEIPQILNPTGKQTPLEIPANPKAGIIGKESKPTTIETPPILPQQTTNPVETPPIFEQPSVEIDTQKPIVKGETPIETPPIIVQPQTKPVTLKTNTQRAETNNEPTIETPPIIAVPENGNASTKTEKTFSTTKAEYLNSAVKTENPNTIKKTENNIAKSENNTAKSDSNTAKVEVNTAKIEQSTARVEVNTAKAEQGTAKIENNTAKLESNNAKIENGTAKAENNNPKSEIKNQFPSILMNTDKTTAATQKDWNTVRTETQVQPELNMIQQALNLAKMNGKIVRREASETVNATVTNASSKDHTPILIPNENVVLEYSVKTENFDVSSEKSGKLQNILFNMIAANPAESSEADKPKGFGKISLNEFQINETAKNPMTSKADTNFSVSENNGEAAEFMIEANAELFTKSVFPKRKSLGSAYEAANIIRSEENLNAKFELPQVARTPNVAENIQITEQVEMQMTELAAKVERTKETQILKMRLNPAELGTVEIHLEKSADGHLKAHFSTESETARTALHENIDQLRNTLEKAGWQVGAVEVTVSTTATDQFNGSRNNGENQPNSFYQSFSKVENADNLSQTEPSEKDDLSHIVSLRA